MAKEHDPRMHTAEHVLNQCMVRRFDCGRSFSSHVNSGKSKCDYHFARPLTEEEAQDITAEVNRVLAAHLPVSERVAPRSEAEQLVYLGKLPPSVGPDAPIRLIAVGDYDLCACIGQHVENTREVGVFRLISHDFTPGEEGTGGTLRVRFTVKQADTH